MRCPREIGQAMRSNTPGRCVRQRRDVLTFVSDHHRALTDGRIMSMYGLEPSLAPAANAADQDFASYGFTSHASIDHGIAHTVLGVCKA
jgi:hypothetical protein